MPPDPAMAMGPAMMPPPMPGGMPPMPGGMPGQLPPELMMATEDLSAQAGENMVEEELMGDIQQATLASEAPVADSMATQTGALVDAVGGMSNGAMPMDPMLMAAMEDEALAAPGPMGPYPV